MFCPNCKAEYREGFTRCADCGVELVPSLDNSAPSESMTDSDAWVVLWKGSDPVLASRLGADLEAEGIAFHMAQGIAGSLYGAAVPSMPTLVIHVSPSDQSRASQVERRIVT